MQEGRRKLLALTAFSLLRRETKKIILELGTRAWLPNLVACEHFQKCMLNMQVFIKPQTY